MGKSLSQWLDQYSESHQNPTNQNIHKICVPVIFLSVLGLLWDWQFAGIRLVWFAVVLALPFYIRLGRRALTILLPQLMAYLGLLYFFFQEKPAWPVFLTLFVIAWIGQFIGHKIEGKKPSFFEDLQFLLIGPLWVFKSRTKDQ